MEINVWIQLFVRVVTYVSRLFSSSRNLQNQTNGGELQNALENVAGATLTSMSVTNQLHVLRNPSLSTTDAVFGHMAFDGQDIGVTMERTAVMIPEGTYRGYKRDSAHFGMRVVGIDVPNRSNIECHPANYPSQLLGCVAVGTSRDGDALDNSDAAFDKMMETVPEEFTVVVESLKA